MLLALGANQHPSTALHSIFPQLYTNVVDPKTKGFPNLKLFLIFSSPAST